MKFNIKEIVKNNFVEFVQYCQGVFYYRVMVYSAAVGLEPGFEGTHFIFPVLIADIGDATLPRVEKAIMFMRYIRKAIEEGTFVEQANVEIDS